MTSKKQQRVKIPVGTSFDRRGILLAERLGYRKVTPSSTVWSEHPTARHMILMWAWIGGELAEKEPEFRWGQGRRKGSKAKQLNPKPSKDAARQRRRRAEMERSEKS
jgi:hypothetical protein